MIGQVEPRVELPAAVAPDHLDDALAALDARALVLLHGYGWYSICTPRPVSILTVTGRSDVSRMLTTAVSGVGPGAGASSQPDHCARKSSSEKSHEFVST